MLEILQIDQFNVTITNPQSVIGQWDSISLATVTYACCPSLFPIFPFNLLRGCFITEIRNTGGDSLKHPLQILH